ncbi:branched-chain amino acid ABC transporter permease [Acrocarpospora macrocephala]|uniref:Branched-chain amino acid ABC transporter permease n=1 Tax=Acrocarpospora macrocephala TaxID=150177 RepID=A0A5M3WRE1_9ACTN|nr:branched-chain amino acid ABC transporter permease [Acrocarpospora macrocephala]GES11170.1 branched-chain amino acid ABC transporter permease [Acrocarpospora macrocephala]
MTDFLNAVWSGSGFGSLYGLVALGLVVIFKSTGILNFSGGALMAVGGVVAAGLGAQGFWVAAGIAVVAVAGVGAVANLTVMRPLLGRGLFPGVMVTIGLASVIEGTSGLLFGRQPRFLPDPIGVPTFDLPFGTSMSSTLAVALGLSAAATVLLAIAFNRTSVGLQLRAAAVRPEVASMFGANPGRIFTYAWAVAGGLAALAGALLASLTVADISIATFALRAFAAMIVGGVDSLGGAFLGGILVGVTEMLAGTYLGDDFRLPSTMVVLMVFLMVRPQGLFGTPEVVRP